MLRVCQANCYADFSGNRPDASWLLRQPQRGHLPALREMFPGNCSDTDRLLPGECPDDSSDVAQMLRRISRLMLRGHCATCCLTFM